MGKLTPPLQPDESLWRRARKDCLDRERLTEAGWQLVIAVLTVFAAYGVRRVISGADLVPGAVESVWLLFVALPVAAVLRITWSLLRSPVQQRDEARKERDALRSTHADEVARLHGEIEQLLARRSAADRLQLARKLCVGAARELEAALADSSVFSRIASWSYRFPRFLTEAFAVESVAPGEILGAFSKANNGHARETQMALVRIIHDAASRLQPESLAPDFDPLDGEWQTWAPAKEFPYRASGSLRESSDGFAVKAMEAAALIAESRGHVDGGGTSEERLDTLHGMCNSLVEFCDTEIRLVRNSGSDNLNRVNEFCMAVVDVLRSTLTPKALRAEHAAFDRATELAFLVSPPQPVAALLASRAWIVAFRDRVNESQMRNRFLPLNAPEAIVNGSPPH